MKPFFPWLIIVLVLYWLVFRIYQDSLFLRRPRVHAPGTVIGYRRIRQEGGQLSLPIIRFESDDSRSIEFTNSWGSFVLPRTQGRIHCRCRISGRTSRQSENRRIVFAAAGLRADRRGSRGARGLHCVSERMSRCGRAKTKISKTTPCKESVNPARRAFCCTAARTRCISDAQVSTSPPDCCRNGTITRRTRGYRRLNCPDDKPGTRE